MEHGAGSLSPVVCVWWGKGREEDKERVMKTGTRLSESQTETCLDHDPPEIERPLGLAQLGYQPGHRQARQNLEPQRDSEGRLHEERAW